MSNFIYTCSYCQKTFSRKRKKRNVHKFCCLEHYKLYRKKPEKHCQHCNKIITSTNSKKFCNTSCSASYNNKKRGQRTVETRNKISNTLKTFNKEHKNPEYTKIYLYTCIVCNNNFYNKSYRTKLTCSSSCLIIHQKNSTGGARKGAGNSKHGWFKGIHCDSTYELAFLIYCLDHNIPIKRNKKYWSYYDPERGKIFKYYPDFLINNKMLIEIKGIKTNLNYLKLNSVDEPIKILYKKDLLKIFNYVKSKYNLPYTRFYELYNKCSSSH